jgi:hypothetical protein
MKFAINLFTVIFWFGFVAGILMLLSSIALDWFELGLMGMRIIAGASFGCIVCFVTDMIRESI